MANLKVDTISGIGTEGPVLSGGLKFRSKNYLTLPKGTTAERTTTSSGISTVVGAIRYNTDSNKMECYVNSKWMIVSTSSPNLDGGGRGLVAGGVTPSESEQGQDAIEYMSLASTGNAISFGNLVRNHYGFLGGMSSKVRGIFSGGVFYTMPGGPGTYIDDMDLVTIATTGDATDFGNLVQGNVADVRSASNETRGLVYGGNSGPSPVARTNTISFTTIATTGSSVDFGDMTVPRQNPTGSTSPTRLVMGSGEGNSPTNSHESLEFVTISSTGNAQDFGDCIFAKSYRSACGNSTRGLIAGGYGFTNQIESYELATLGNTVDFGDLLNSQNNMPAMSTPTRAVWAGGNVPGNNMINTIQYVTIQTAGDANDFGDLANPMRSGGGLSNSHGGL